MQYIVLTHSRFFFFDRPGHGIFRSGGIGTRVGRRGTTSAHVGRLRFGRRRHAQQKTAACGQEKVGIVVIVGRLRLQQKRLGEIRPRYVFLQASRGCCEFDGQGSGEEGGFRATPLDCVREVQVQGRRRQARCHGVEAMGTL